MAITATQQQEIVELVVGMFDAAPGGVYMNDFTQYVEAVSAADPTADPIESLANILTQTATFQSPAFFPSFLTNDQFADKYIEQLVGTDVATADKDWAKGWMEGMLNAGVSRGEAILEAVRALNAVPSTDAVWGTAAQDFDNEVTVAQYYTVVAGGSATDVLSLQAVIAGVTATTDVSTDAAIQAVIEASGTLSGATFVLTPGQDFADSDGSIRNIVGGTGIPSDFHFTTANEIVTASNVTMTAVDALFDGTTTDNDVLNLALGATTFLGNIADIETFNVTATNPVPAGVVFAPGSVTGLDTLNISGTPAAGVTIFAGIGGTQVGDTGVTTIDGSGLTSVAAALFVNSSTAVANAALTITGGAGADSLSGGLGSDTISGGGNVDTINGGAAGDTLNGDDGNDLISGVSGNDTLNGGAGADVLGGGANNDTFNGGAGNDILGMNSLGTIALVEADVAAPGDGNDTVVFAADLAANGADIVYGFAAGLPAAGGDVLNVSAFLGAPVTFATAAAATITGPNTFSAGGANVVAWGAQALVDTVADGVLSLTELATATANGWIDLGNNAHVVIAYDDTVGGSIPAAPGPVAASGTGTALEYVTTDVNGDITSVELVGVVDLVVSTNLLATNFA